ncbi:MAG: DNA methyltransferase [Gemmataceae bacterium]
MTPPRRPPTPDYARGGVTVYHADCRAVLPSFPGGSVDFVLTDPPYLVSYRGRWGRGGRPIAGDDGPGDWLLPAYAELRRVLRPDGFCVSFYGWPHADAFLGAWRAAGFRPVSHLAFVKRQWGFGRFTRGRHETAFVLAKGRPPKPARAIADVIDWRRERATVHPNQKPVASLTPLLASLAPPGGLVLDPFMGSGSTLLAARALGLPAVGVEVDRAHCEAAVRRLAGDDPLSPSGGPVVADLFSAADPGGGPSPC